MPVRSPLGAKVGFSDEGEDVDIGSVGVDVGI
jgi:hypothetical protein